MTNDGSYKYYYDCENRLVCVNDISDNQVASYEYDYLGRRVEKTVYGSPNVTIKYCYSGDQIITEYEGWGVFLKSIIYSLLQS